jgi:hypothetical protein
MTVLFIHSVPSDSDLYIYIITCIQYVIKCLFKLFFECYTSAMEIARCTQFSVAHCFLLMGYDINKSVPFLKYVFNNVYAIR